MPVSITQVVLLLFLVFLVFFVLFQKGAPRYAKAFFCFLAFLFGIWSLFFLAADHFTGKGVDSSVLFHLRYGIDAKILGMFKGFVFILIALVLLLFLFTYYLYKKIPLEKGKPIHIFLVFLFCGAFYLHPASKNFIGLAHLSFSMEPGLEEKMTSFYKAPVLSSAASTPANKKNLIFIYLESFEQNFTDEKFFPGLTPGLKKLGESGFRFTNLSQVPGTDWTLAGIMASQCGMPFLLNLHPASSGKLLPPQTQCMGDLLAQNDYHLEYYGGASLDFANKGNFLSEHGFSSVNGFDELRPQLPKRSSTSDWGLHDDTLFDLFFQRYLKLLETKEPFGLFGLTLTTHAYPWVILPESCAEISYGDGKIPFLNACQCSDRLLYELVEKIQQADTSKNTLIVLASDHLAMLTDSKLDETDKKNRRNLFLILGSDLPKGGTSNKAASTLDIGVTVLNLMGFSIEELHLGRNLLGDDKTFVETFSNEKNALSLPFFSKLFSPPQFMDGIRIIPESNEVQLDSQNLSWPILFYLEKSAKVKSFIQPEAPDAPFLPTLKKDTFFMWIDTYASLKFLDEAPEGNKKGLYLAVGKLDSEVTLLPLGKGEMNLSLKEIQKFLKGKSDPKLYATRHKRMEAIRKDGDYIRQDVDMLLSGGSLSMGSKGGNKRGPAMLGEMEIVEKGFTLFGFDKNGKAQKLAHIDPRNPEKPGHFPLIGKNFAETIKLYNNPFQTYAILLHGNGVSEKTELSSLFNGLPLSGWKHLAPEAPYIGLWTKYGTIYEQTGDPDTALLIELKNFHDPENPTIRREKPAPIARARSVEDLHNQKIQETILALDFALGMDGKLIQPYGINPEILEKWLEQNPRTRIIASFSNKRLQGLARIKETYSKYQNRFIAEIHSAEEYELAKLFGYEDILWNLKNYRELEEKIGAIHRSGADLIILKPKEETPTVASLWDSERYRNPEGRVAGFIKRNGMDLFALVIGEDKACSGLPFMVEIPVYLQTSKGESAKDFLNGCGLAGQYTIPSQTHIE